MHSSVVILVLLLICQVLSQNLVLLSPSDFVQTFRDNRIKVIASPIGLKPKSGILHGKIALAQPLSACIDVEEVGQQDDQEDIFLLTDDLGCLQSVKAQNIAASGAYIGIIKRNINNTLHDRQINIVHIPILEIDPNDYDRITNYLAKNPQTSISVVADFNSEVIGQKKINMQLWLSPTQEEAYQYALELQRFVLNQPEYIGFEPHFVLHSQGAGRKQFIGCYSSGKFCPPELQYEGRPEGAKIVGESLRQIVIADQGLKKWFDYSSYYYANCLRKQTDSLWQEQNSQLCSQAAMISCGISYNKVSTEINKSFQGPRPQVDSNIYLQQQRQLYLSQKITQHPILLLNGKQYPLSMSDPSQLKLRICNMIHPDPNLQTPECQTFTNPPLFTTGEIMIIVGVGVVLLVGVMVGCKMVIYRRMKKQMKGEVDKTLSQYYKYMDTFEDPDSSAVGKVPLMEPKMENNQIGSVELSEMKSQH